MLKTRLLALVAAFAVGFAPMAAVAQLQRAPAYTSGGQPIPATGVFCLNLDGTSCAFGGGSGAVTAASGSFLDGWNLTAGSKGDPAATDATSSWGEIALLKALLAQALSTASSPVSIDQTTQGTTNGVQLKAGTAIAGKVGIDQTTPGTTNGVVINSATTGGDTPYGLQTAASTNSTLVSTGAHTLRGMSLINTTTTIYYLRMYDAAVAPTCSSATGYSRSWPIPPASSSGLAGGIAPSLSPAGVAFVAGLAFCVTGGPSSTDNTNAAVGVFINLDYK